MDGMAKTIRRGEFGNPHSVLFPSDGRKLPVTCGRSLRRWVVGTFDAVSGGRGCLTSWSRSAMLCSGARGIRFEFQIPTEANDSCIEIQETRPTSIGHPTKVDSFRVYRGFGGDGHQIYFSSGCLG